MNQAIFNQFVEERWAAAWTAAIFKPAQALFPRVKASNFGFHAQTEEYCPQPRLSGLGFKTCPAGAVAGNTQAPSFYPNNITISTILSVAAAIRAGNIARTAAGLSEAQQAIWPWVSGPSVCLFSKPCVGAQCFRHDWSYWVEMLYHVALSGADGFCKIVMLSRFTVVPISLTLKVHHCRSVQCVGAALHALPLVTNVVARLR